MPIPVSSKNLKEYFSLILVWFCSFLTCNLSMLLFLDTPEPTQIFLT